MLRSSHGPEIYLRGAILQLIYGGLGHHLFREKSCFFGWCFSLDFIPYILTLLENTLKLVSRLIYWFLQLEREVPLSVCPLS